jgi:hypothetical protein
MKTTHLVEIIRNLQGKFKKNELAYLALTGKIELPLRDKIAFSIQYEFSKDFIVAREWTNKENHKRFDIAIFDKNVECNFPDYLIEFKARAVPGFQDSYSMRVIKDFKKLLDSGDNDTVRYFVLFNTIITGKLRKSLNPAIDKYLRQIYSFAEEKRIINYEQIRSEIKNNWNNYLKSNNLEKNSSKIIEIEAGKFFGLSVYILTMIYGPIKKDIGQTKETSK